MRQEWKIISAMVILAVVTLLSACGSDSGQSQGTIVPFAQVATAQTGFVQVEQLARPAISEATFITNGFLNAYNSLTPDVVAFTVLPNSSSPVTQEAVNTLSALGNDATRIGDIVTAFFPDVLRIDSAIASPVGTAAYANDPVPVGSQGVVMPRAGRKIEDDTIDVTLSVLSNGAITSDNANYSSNSANTVPAADNPAQGHHLLNGQSAPNGAATFPFLAPPN